MMGGGQNRGEIVIFCCHTRPGLDPTECQVNHTLAKPRPPASHSWATQYIGYAPGMYLVAYVIEN